MQVRIEGLPITLEWIRCVPFFRYPGGGKFEVSLAEALQFEILAKLDNLEQAIKDQKIDAL